MKRFSLVLISIALTFILSACVVKASDSVITEYLPDGDVWIRASVDELALGATDIVWATILDSRVEPINTLLGEPNPDEEYPERFYVIHTIYRISVLESFKGSTEAGDIIEFATPGGRFENRELINPKQLHFNYGENLIFFLHSFESDGFGHLPMVLESLIQAVYRVSLPDTFSADILSEGAIDIFSDGIIAASKENNWLADEVLENFSPENNFTVTFGDLIRFSNEFE